MSKRAGSSDSLSSASSSSKRQAVPAEESTQAEELAETQLNELDDSEGEDDESPHSMTDDRIEDKMPSEAGIIDKIYCENFMNHTKLTVNFCRNINFIHGQNGSGKSAILAALQICLGARASVTHRGESLGALVRRNKEGKHTSTAKVQVTLLNGGSDAFQPDKYGKKITVERVFDQTKNTYKLYDEKMRFVSNKKRDLELMLDRLNVQVDNPVCIMDQENSKEFIKGSEKDKYRFYTRATDLERVVGNLRATKAELDQMGAIFQSTHERLQDYKHDYEKAVKDFEELKKVMEFDGKIIKLNCNLFWIDVQNKERELKETETQEETLTLKKAERIKILEKLKIEQASSTSHTDILAEIDRLKNDSVEAQKNVERLNKEVGEAKKPVNQCEREIQQNKRNHADYVNEAKSLEKMIRDAKAENSRSTGAEVQQKVQKYDEIKEKLARNEAEYHSLSSSVSNIGRERDEAQRVLEECTSDHKQAAAEVREIEGSISQMRAAQDVPATQFGQNVPQILNAIARETRFRKKPVGPLGAYIKMREDVPGGSKKWGRVISTALSSELSVFTCDNFNDSKLLQDILNKCRAANQHKVHVLRFAKRYENLHGPNFNGALTIKDVIEVENDVAFNALIERSSIESVCLFDSIEAAETGCFTGSGGNLRLATNVRGAYDADGRYTSVNNGNKFVQQTGRNRVVSFGVNVDAQLAQLSQELVLAKGNEAQIRQQLNQLKTDAQTKQRLLNETQSKMRALEGSSKRDMENKLVKLRDEIDAMEGDTGTDTTEWEDDLAKVKEKIQENQSLLEDIRVRKADFEKLVNDKNTEKATFQKTAYELGNQMQQEEDKLASILRSQNKNKMMLEKAQKKVEDATQVLEEIKVLGEKRLDAVEKSREQARKYTIENLGPDTEMPMRVDADANTVKAKITTYRERKAKMLSVLKPGQRDIDEAAQRAAKAKQVLEEKTADVKRVEKNKEELEEDLTHRLARWKRFRKGISSLTTSKFDETLQRKGQCGRLDFNHKEKELHITVQKDNRDSQSQIENVKLLSGGERSFATLSLLIALGEAVECPFRVMDEFDVFMDAVSRKIALDQLVQEGLLHKHRQFIFITPQDLSSIVPNNEVKIIKLQNPNRSIEGQGTL